MDGRACSVERELLYNNIYLCETKVSVKDSIISSKNEKEKSYKKQIAAYQAIEQTYIVEVESYKNQLRKKRNSMIGIGVGGITVTLGLLALGTYIAIVK